MMTQSSSEDLQLETPEAMLVAMEQVATAPEMGEEATAAVATASAMEVAAAPEASARDALVPAVAASPART